VSLEVPEGVESINFVRDERSGSITDCSSLVNLYMSPLQEVEDFNRNYCGPFPEDFQLAKVATDWRDLLAKIQHRFDGLPLHKVCYFHSYHPVEDTSEKIRNFLKLNPNAVNLVDTFGMTPLHILSLAQKPVVELVQELPTFTKMALSSKDLFGSSPLDYLCKNPFREGMHATRWMIRKILEGRLPFLGLDQWKQELLGAEERVRSAADASVMSDGVESLLDKLARLEFLEILSLVEMILWRIRLDEIMMVEGDDEKPRSDRESCRVQCGISIVVGNVSPFLGKNVST